jgi:hypothetical protein
MSSGYWATEEQIEPPKRPPQHWKEKGMLSMQYQLSRRKAVRKSASDRRQDEGWAYKLELNGHEAEVNDLDQRPDHKVCLQSWHIHITELVADSSSSTSLCNSHSSEKYGNT